VLIAIHGLILIYGGAYTYARVPAGLWLQELLGFARNPYDRIGHLAQGFVPAIVARELLLRGFISRAGNLFFLVVCITLATSAFYELIEWWRRWRWARAPTSSSAHRVTLGHAVGHVPRAGRRAGGVADAGPLARPADRTAAVVPVTAPSPPSAGRTTPDTARLAVRATWRGSRRSR